MKWFLCKKGKNKGKDIKNGYHSPLILSRHKLSFMIKMIISLRIWWWLSCELNRLPVRGSPLGHFRSQQMCSTRHDLMKNTLSQTRLVSCCTRGYQRELLVGLNVDAGCQLQMSLSLNEYPRYALTLTGSWLTSYPDEHWQKTGYVQFVPLLTRNLFLRHLLSSDKEFILPYRLYVHLPESSHGFPWSIRVISREKTQTEYFITTNDYDLMNGMLWLPSWESIARLVACSLTLIFTCLTFHMFNVIYIAPCRHKSTTEKWRVRINLRKKDLSLYTCC